MVPCLKLPYTEKRKIIDSNHVVIINIFNNFQIAFSHIVTPQLMMLHLNIQQTFQKQLQGKMCVQTVWYLLEKT